MASSSFEDEGLDDHLGTAADLLRAMAQRWRFRMQAGRLGQHPLHEVTMLVERLERAGAALVPTTERPASASPPPDGDRFRQLVDNVRDYAIFMLADDGRIESWNAGGELILRYRAEEILGQNFALFHPTEERDSDKPRRELEVASREGRYEEQGWRVRKGGERFWAHVTLTALRDPRANVTGFAKVVQDLTDLRDAHERLLQSEDRMRLMVEAVRDYAIFMLDPQGRVASWNVGAERLKGYTAEEIIGQHFSKFYPEEERLRGHPDDELRIAVAEGRYEEEGWRIRKDGSRFWANVVITALFDSEGRHVGFTKVTRDFTETRRLREAQLALQVRDEFLSIAGHELRTPLAAMLMQVQSLARSVEPGTRVSERLRGAERAGRRLKNLLDQVLDVSRISSGRLELDPEPLHLDAVVREVADQFADSSVEAGSPIALQLAPVAGEWDRLRIEQVITNLLSNALKYGRGKPIEIALASEGAEAVLQVRDHGVGIAPEERERIFERFERSPRTREYGGLGLGLWIARSIVRASGGRIEASGQPGEGAAFTLHLPLRPEERDGARP